MISKVAISSFMLIFTFLPAFGMVAKVSKIIRPEKEEDYLVLMDSGHVIFVRSLDKSKISEYYEKLNNNEEVHFEPENPKGISSKFNSAPVPRHIQSAFDELNPNWKTTGQCHDKAHVWVYEASFKQIEMRKMFVFFTQKYIRQYRFPWWFHVSPIMNDGGKTFVMDGVFLKSPSSVREWTSTFLENKTICSKIRYYSTYAENKWDKDCYLIETNKYMRQPSDIKAQLHRTRFIIQEVRNAYARAFDLQTDS